MSKKKWNNWILMLCDDGDDLAVDLLHKASNQWVLAHQEDHPWFEKEARNRGLV